MTIDTNALRKFSQQARRQLLEQVAARMEYVLQTDNVEIREKENAVKELQEQIKQSSKEAVIDRVAYTWFNRFCALRYMDVNHYTPLGIVSPMEGFTQPEILQEAKQGVIDDSFKIDKQRVFALLNGQLPSSHPQQEAYRLLLVGACNAYYAQMPFLFPEIEDYTELLMPDDLLSENSVLQGMRDTLTPDACQDVEVIGWLYQYYISERKDEVFEDLRNNKKIEAKDIPAATQLFTPHWIVRYLVENTLGRLWMINHPDSKLIEHMDFYISPVQEETDFLEFSNLEEIKICDPACGSGHMLTYAFDLLYAIYEEQGYDPLQIPNLILKNNLYGIEIDKRAGDLAAFALMMKARKKDHHFFIRNLEPNICILKNVSITTLELDAYKNAIGQDLFNQDLWVTLQQFEQAENFGSLIRPQLKDIGFILEELEEKGVFNDLFLHSTSQKILKVLRMAEYLNQRYHVVIANPPYMGSKGMNDELKDFLNEHYEDVKSDLFSAFIIRNLELAKPKGQLGFMSPYVWMFISSYKKLRKYLIKNKTITSLVQLEYSGFSEATVPICTYTIENSRKEGYESAFIQLTEFKGSENQAPKALEAIKNPKNSWFYRKDTKKFLSIPGSPIAFWVSDQVGKIFSEFKLVSEIAAPGKGSFTGDNQRFIRYFWEVANDNCIRRCASHEESNIAPQKWYPLQKGGEFRKWYGNSVNVLNFQYDGKELKDFPGYGERNPQYFFLEGLSWTQITSSKFSARYSSEGHMYDNASCICPVFDKINLLPLLGFLNSNSGAYILNSFSQTLNYLPGDISRLPFHRPPNIDISIIKQLIKISKKDWDHYESSWDFSISPILKQDHHHSQLSTTYNDLRNYWGSMSEEMKKLEDINNQIFLDTYGLSEELTKDVELRDVTIRCNPQYRYPDSRSKQYSDQEREFMLLEDTMKEFISYAVGCMFGRYSLDKPGLILASSGDTVRDYIQHVPEPTFTPDENNVIPLLEGEWFDDDTAERFKDFLKVTFGIENFDENLDFLEGAIGKDIRSYFVKDFYKEHVKMYKKRPIYWLFSSPNGSFNALIYMHRYRPDTISVILNDYLRQYRDKLSAHKTHQEAIERNPGTSQREITQATKEIIQTNKVLAELKEYEDEILYPLAVQQIEINLDDGVKINYNKFGAALKKVTGLSEQVHTNG